MNYFPDEMKLGKTYIMNPVNMMFVKGSASRGQYYTS